MHYKITSQISMFGYKSLMFIVSIERTSWCFIVQHMLEITLKKLITPMVNYKGGRIVPKWMVIHSWMTL
jgi:hypothetical protein